MADTRQYDLVGPDKTTHTLQNLQTYKEYMIVVTAYNIAGEGPSSEPIIAATKQGGEAFSDLLAIFCSDENVLHVVLVELHSNRAKHNGN